MRLKVVWSGKTRADGPMSAENVLPQNHETMIPETLRSAAQAPSDARKSRHARRQIMRQIPPSIPDLTPSASRLSNHLDVVD